MILLLTVVDSEEPIFELPEPVDVVIMNPPFGTKIKGIDMVFLQKAIQVHILAIVLMWKLSNHTVYSLHKTSTRAVWSYFVSTKC